jgi:hypothetical protein
MSSLVLAIVFVACSVTATESVVPFVVFVAVNDTVRPPEMPPVAPSIASVSSPAVVALSKSTPSTVVSAALSRSDRPMPSSLPGATARVGSGWANAPTPASPCTNGSRLSTSPCNAVVSASVARAGTANVASPA